MNHNNLNKIDDRTFQNLTEITFLNLSYCQIEQLHRDSFVGLHKLESLDLRHNQIILPEGLRPGLFPQQTSLKVLKMLGQLQYDGEAANLTYPDQVLSDLKMLTFLSLDGLSLLHVINLGLGFRNLNFLESLVFGGRYCLMGEPYYL